MQIIESSSIAGVIKRSFDRPGRNWIKHMVFPDFQRPYCWSLSDIQKILDDIDELRYSPQEERYREEDEYYLGSICIMPVKDCDDPDHAHDMAILDGQQRLTSFMILARVLYERAMASSNSTIHSYGANIAWIMGRDLAWKRAFLYREPVTLRRIREVYRELDREYRQLESDSSLDISHDANSLSFYEETLLRDLKRFRYILISGRVAVTVLNSLREAEQYFQGENNRGLPMSLLDILKAYHMRFETDPNHLREIREIWSVFNDTALSESAFGKEESEATRQNTVLSLRRQAVEAHVIPALLMRCSIEPWSWSANIPQNADYLKGIVGTHRRDRIVDGKLSASTDKRLFDLLEPVQTGIGFFRMLDQYRRIDAAIELLETGETPNKKLFNPTAGLNFNGDQRLVLRLALIAWTDRFAPRSDFDKAANPGNLADALAADSEFRAYARHFARFLNRLRNEDDETAPGAFRRLDKKSLLRCLCYESTRTSLIFLPHRSSTPAACKRALLLATTPKAMAPLIHDSTRSESYRLAYDMEIAAEKSVSAADSQLPEMNEEPEHA